MSGTFLEELKIEQKDREISADIYNTGEIPRKWLESIFVTLPEKSTS